MGRRSQVASPDRVASGPGTARSGGGTDERACDGARSAAGPVPNPHFTRRRRCPACGSDRLDPRVRRPYSEPAIRDYLEAFYAAQGRIELEYLHGASYSLAECRACTLIFQEEIPDEGLMERLYERWIDPREAFARNQREHDLARCSADAQEIMQTIACLGRAPGALRVFDFGMGWGRWALMAKAFGCEVYGAELSRARAEHATSNGINVIAWDDISGHRFDFINTEQVFEHLAEPLETLRRLAGSLKEDGLLKICVPTAHDIGRRLRLMDWRAAKGTRNSLNPVAPLEHVNFFTRRSLLAMAALAGLEEAFVPLRLQYQFTTHWRGLERIIRNIFVPVYRNILKRQNYLLFRKCASPAPGAAARGGGD